MNMKKSIRLIFIFFIAIPLFLNTIEVFADSHFIPGRKVRLKAPEFYNALFITPWLKGHIVYSSSDTLYITSSSVQALLNIPIDQVSQLELYDGGWTYAPLDSLSTIVVASKDDIQIQLSYSAPLHWEAPVRFKLHKLEDMWIVGSIKALSADSLQIRVTEPTMVKLFSHYSVDFQNSISKYIPNSVSRDIMFHRSDIYEIESKVKKRKFNLTGALTGAVIGAGLYQHNLIFHPFFLTTGAVTGGTVGAGGGRVLLNAGIGIVAGFGIGLSLGGYSALFFGPLGGALGGILGVLTPRNQWEPISLHQQVEN